jgi:hypothetical protein
MAVMGVESAELRTEVPRAYITRKGGLNICAEEDNEKINVMMACTTRLPKLGRVSINLDNLLISLN